MKTFKKWDPKGHPEKLATPLEYIQEARDSGFTEDFIIRNHSLYPMGQERPYPAVSITIVDFHRFEGVTDPADNSIVYLLETDDGVKGTLTDAFGMYADEEVGKFIKNVEALSDMDKKNKDHEDSKNSMDDTKKAG